MDNRQGSLSQSSAEHKFYWDAIQTVRQSLRLFFCIFAIVSFEGITIFWIFPLKLIITSHYFRNFCWILFTYCNSFFTLFFAELRARLKLWVHFVSNLLFCLSPCCDFIVQGLWNFEINLFHKIILSQRR